MDDVIKKTKQLIEVFEDSSLINNLEHYKTKIIMKKELLELINKYNNTSDDYEKISLKKAIYQDNDYKQYMKYYNELFYYILKINMRFKSYTREGRCKY